MALRRLAGFAVTIGVLLVSVVSCSTANVIDIYTALDADGNRKRQEFFTDTKEIHCVVEAGISRPGVTLETVFRQLQAYDFSNGKYYETDRVFAQAEFSPGATGGSTVIATQLVTTNELGEPTGGLPFVPGRFQCEVRLDGELQGVAIFNIKFPDCPTAEIQNNTFCGGFYEINRECRRYGFTSRDEARCTCRDNARWQCE